MTIAETMKAAVGKRVHVVLTDGKEIIAVVDCFGYEKLTGRNEAAIRFGKKQYDWGALESDIKSIKILN